jgi:excisionase family DNA binding protein
MSSMRRGYIPVVADGTEWLSTQEGADRLGITPRTLYKLINEGKMPGYKVGRLIKVKASDVDLFIEGHRIKPGDLDHLYPERSDVDATDTSETDESGT